MSSLLILSGVIAAIFGFGGWALACTGYRRHDGMFWSQNRVTSSAAALGIALMLTGGFTLDGGSQLSASLGENHPWYERVVAAEAGDAQAQFEVANQFYYGRDGFPQDYVEAAKWHRLAARQGHVRAMYRLSSLYAKGRGVKKDATLAQIWSRKAARGTAG